MNIQGRQCREESKGGSPGVRINQGAKSHKKLALKEYNSDDLGLLVP